jgi:hypothetical protein
VVDAVRVLCAELGRKPTVAEYLAHRLRHDKSLPSLGRLYRLFPLGWDEVAAAARP